MYLMYVDESGDCGLLNSPTRYFVLSGIVVHESKWRELIDTLLEFKKKMKALHNLPTRSEIHASEFINSRAYGLEKHVRLAILRNALDELAKLNYISITNVVVDKMGKAPDFDVFNKAWMVLFQRFENTLVNGNFPGGVKNDNGMVLTDATAGHALTSLVRRMAVFNHVPNDIGVGSRNIPIKRIIEDPHQKDSRSSLPIQMCDVVAYFLSQKLKPNSYIRRTRSCNYFDRLKRRAVKQTQSMTPRPSSPRKRGTRLSAISHVESLGSRVRGNDDYLGCDDSN